MPFVSAFDAAAALVTDTTVALAALFLAGFIYSLDEKGKRFFVFV